MGPPLPYHSRASLLHFLSRLSRHASFLSEQFFCKNLKKIQHPMVIFSIKPAIELENLSIKSGKSNIRSKKSSIELEKLNIRSEKSSNEMEKSSIRLAKSSNEYEKLYQVGKVE